MASSVYPAFVVANEIGKEGKMFDAVLTKPKVPTPAERLLDAGSGLAERVAVRIFCRACPPIYFLQMCV